MTPADLLLTDTLSSEQIRRTGRFIADLQRPDGSIPWFVGGKIDVWDHVESAMGLSVVGRDEAARAAYAWMANSQSADGSWPMEMLDGQVVVASSDTNQCAYLATGLWHHHLVTGADDLLAQMWPTLEAAVEFVLTHQGDSGTIIWAVDEQRRPDTFALRTGNASILHALTCADAIAGRLGHARPHWELAAMRLRVALSERATVFADRSRYSMDWYYPVLGGALRDEAAEQALAAGWDAFVWPGYGVRCVSDRPWVTAAESSELVLALDAVGHSGRAAAVLRDIQCMRDESTGGYWTGYVVDDDAFWPVEQTSWTAAAVLLAFDAVAGRTGGSGIFRDHFCEGP